MDGQRDLTNELYIFLIILIVFLADAIGEEWNRYALRYENNTKEQIDNNVVLLSQCGTT